MPFKVFFSFSNGRRDFEPEEELESYDEAEEFALECLSEMRVGADILGEECEADYADYEIREV